MAFTIEELCTIVDALAISVATDQIEKQSAKPVLLKIQKTIDEVDSDACRNLSRVIDNALERLSIK